MDLLPSRLHQLTTFPFATAAEPRLSHIVPFLELQRQPPAQLLPDRCPEDAAGRAAFLLSLDNVPDPFSGTPCADALLGVTLQFSPTVRVVQCGPWRLGVDQRSLLLWLGLLRSTARASAVQLNQDWKTAQLLERQMWSRIQLQGTSTAAVAAASSPEVMKDGDDDDRPIPDESLPAPRSAFHDTMEDALLPGQPHPSDPSIPPLHSSLPRWERQGLITSAQDHRLSRIRAQLHQRRERILHELSLWPLYHPALLPPRLDLQAQLPLLWNDVHR